ncbi:Cell cycle checkpoint protein RAD17-like Protein [Tribolium castaneum]|uniref:Cell cycle checkpoint protein RAD17-like Protein n=1 Tax=Tribolium castaneum TaxID=7070 RepID=D6WXK2_TRICA|nr:PREDICTED: cell cycle checkpoint protein RAD17 [Tribolium castaneum]EFA07969.1 Cell cycle checkpoint protein RAD17-like Protein [Tribolium castaneum]|eukprot:XP_971233.1 PREDICTED: cell cycle checkpoint protein RAD17 [Tribolium castaneum]
MKKTGNKWLGLSLDLENGAQNGHPPKPAIPSKNGTSDLSPVPKKRSFNFHQRLAPKTVPDLAVHSKKIAEVEHWLQNNVCDNKNNSPNAKFLLISGPPGSGKSITIQVLCKKLSIDITEWVNPLDQDFEVCRGANQVTRFVEFLTESKWNSLFSTGNKKVILVEEFPNTFLRNCDEFGPVLEECYYKGNYPVIFVCTDTFDNKINLSEKLFSEDVRVKYKIATISFNGCAPTLMKSALKRAQNLVQGNPDLFKIPSQSTVTAIISTAMGDLKCALNQYYFAALLGTSDLPTIQTQKSGTKRKRDSSTSIQIMSRDENLGLFHALGRVLNPKLGENGRLACDFDRLVNEFTTQPGLFTGFLFENYLKYFGDLVDASQASENLSLGQTFLEKLVDRHDILDYAIWVSVLGLMVHNGHKVSRWNQIKGPTKVQKVVPNREVPVTDLYYYNVINNKTNSGFVLS